MPVGDLARGNLSRVELRPGLASARLSPPHTAPSQSPVDRTVATLPLCTVTRFEQTANHGKSRPFSVLPFDALMPTRRSHSSLRLRPSDPVLPLPAVDPRQGELEEEDWIEEAVVPRRHQQAALWLLQHLQVDLQASFLHHLIV